MKNCMANISGGNKETTGILRILLRFLSSLLLFLFCGCFFLRSEEDASQKVQSEHLLESLARTEKPEHKIAILRSLSSLNIDKPEEISYLKQMFEVASQVDSVACVYEAIDGLTRCYSNQNELDSLLLWVNYVDSLANVRNEIPKELLSIHNSLCRCYLVHGEYELAMNEAVKQQLLAEKSQYELGFVYSNENLGLVYVQTDRFKESISAFESCIETLGKIGNSAVYEAQIAEFLFRIYMFDLEYEKARQLLDYYEERIELIKLENKMYIVEDCYMLLYIYRIHFYSKMNEPTKAKEAINDLEPYRERASNSYASPIYNYTMACYYFMLKDFERSLFYVNGAEEPDIGSFKLKMQLLQVLGRKKEALKAYQHTLNETKERNKIAYTRRIDQLQAIQRLNEQEQKKQNLFRQQQQLKAQKIKVLALTSFSVVLLVALAFLFRYLNRTKKLRNALFLEKQSLNKTHEDLSLAKEKAERAERMKGNFVANISHEIRTPLNAIVGFSALLSDSTQDERSEYIQVINNNSDLLLNLVSDVLDLSHFEADDFTLNIEKVNISACCQHALNAIRQRVAPGVKLTFTHPGDITFSVNTDSLRLQQLLVNLLANAAKFTEQGEINMDYKVGENGKELIFSVTDTGCGIPLDKQKIIFERFEKVNDFKQGAGLGLSICMSISNCFQGRLFVDPTYVDGARFIFVLPFSE